MVVILSSHLPEPQVLSNGSDDDFFWKTPFSSHEISLVFSNNCFKFLDNSQKVPKYLKMAKKAKIFKK